MLNFKPGAFRMHNHSGSAISAEQQEVGSLLEALNAMFKSTGTLEALLARALQQAVELIEAESGLVVLWAEQEARLRAKVAYPDGIGNRLLQNIDAGGTMANGTNGQVQSESNAGAEPVWIEPIRVQAGVVGRIYLALPPFAGGDTAGRRRSFAAIAEHLGLAIEFRQMQRFLSARYAVQALNRRDERGAALSQSLEDHILAAVKNP